MTLAIGTVRVPARFCGPQDSANGGYFSGLVSRLSPQIVTVRLLRPPPLETDLDARMHDDGRIDVLDGTLPIAQARPAGLDLVVPPAPDYVEALDASLHFPGLHHHPFPGCFVCGTARARGDGLRLFPGPLPGRDAVAAAWVPDPSLDGGDGKVAPEFMWAALDCPGAFASGAGQRTLLLGEFTAHVDRRLHVGESATVLAWKIAHEGRKYTAGTAIFDEDGEVCGRSLAVWIEPRLSVVGS